MKKLMAVLAATTALAALPLVANAAPTLSVTATDNGTPLVFTPAMNNAGELTGSFADPLFSQITVDITGVPAVPSPDLGTVTLQISSNSTFTGTHIINLIATQSGLTEPAGFNGTETMTFNNLIGGGGPATETLFINGGALNTHTFPALPPGVSTFTFADNGLGAITSDAQGFSATFTAPSQDIEMTQEFQAAGVAVPEPGTLGLLGSGLAFLGFIGRRRKRTPSGFSAA